MGYNSKEKKAAYAKKYKIKNADKIKLWAKTYRDKNKEKSRQNYLLNKDARVRSNRERRHRNLSSWEGFIPKESSCQICLRTIFFNKKNPKTAVHFDHKQEHNVITRQPSDWLRSSPRTAARELVWRNADLGYLCIDCNSYLPTKNRKEFVRRVVLYVFGISI